jgi:DNA repair protein RadC
VELVSILLGPGRSGDPATLAREILEAGIFADPAQPVAVSAWWNRLGPARASRLLAALELARRSGGEGVRLEPALRSPNEVYEVTADLRPHRREHFVGLYLNSRNRLLARETVSVGSLNASIVHPREVYEPALRHGAASLVVVHNHPSGETDPSEDDLSITRRLSEAGEILGIALLDHVIVGRCGYTSLKELGHL